MFKPLRNTRRPGANVALAIALMCGTAIGVTALEAPAHAQKKKKEKAAKPDYSDSFIAAYKPLETSLNADAPDYSAIKATLPGVLAAAQTADDKYVLGGIYFNVGAQLQDQATQFEGVKMMLESGKTGADKIASYNTIAGQLSYNLQNYNASRTYLERAIEAGADSNGLAGLISETYFNEGRNAEGLNYLRNAINARQSAGLEVDEGWIKRGLSVAYQANLANDAILYSIMYVNMFPSESAWSDAVAIQRNLLQYQPQETLDLLRLARRADVLRDQRDYFDYVDAADFRRLPGEVVAVLAEGVADGSLDGTDPYVAEVRGNASKRVAADRSELPKLAADARKAGASPTLVMATGDAYLNYGEAALAEEFYTMALAKEGTDTQRALTRLGIAQVDQGKTAEAKATFAKIQGDRKAIALLWDAYADSIATPTAAATATDEQPVT